MVWMLPITFVKWDWEYFLGSKLSDANDYRRRREGRCISISNDTFTQFPSDGERSSDELNYVEGTVDYNPVSTRPFSLGILWRETRSTDRLCGI